MASTVTFKQPVSLQIETIHFDLQGYGLSLNCGCLCIQIVDLKLPRMMDTPVMMERDFELLEGSGNVYRDFGDPDANLKQAKAILAARIIAELDDRGLTARKAEEMTGHPATDISCIRNADLERFTLDRLKKIFAALSDHTRA